MFGNCVQLSSFQPIILFSDHLNFSKIVSIKHLPGKNKIAYSKV